MFHNSKDVIIEFGKCMLMLDSFFMFVWHCLAFQEPQSTIMY